MSQRRFSDYHLFRLLKKTPLGTTYRAGRAQARAIDRVVLLHLFDRDPSTSVELWERIHDRAPIQEILVGRLFGRGVELGISEGIPFVAYDYQVGRSLDDILTRARERRMPLSVDQALAIVDQVATALVEAQKLQFKESPILHGSLSPELIQVSHQGKVKTFGFDTAPGLRTLDPDSKYRSPEIRSGAAPAAADDVFSLAAILFEVLTGSPPSKNVPFAAQVDQAVPFGEASPLAPDLQELLKHSLARRELRTPDVVRWRHDLRTVIASEAGGASAFQLSFFLHALFREELESESHEIQEEKAARWTVAAGSETSAETMSPDSLTVPAESDLLPDSLDQDQQEDEEHKEVEEEKAEEVAPLLAAPATNMHQDRSRADFLVGLVASLAVATIAATVFFWINRPSIADSAKSARETSRASKADTQIARDLIASRAALMEKDLKAEYEPRLAQLREQLVTAHRRAATRRATPALRRATPAPQPEIDQVELAGTAPPTQEPPPTAARVDSIPEPAAAVEQSVPDVASSAFQSDADSSDEETEKVVVTPPAELLVSNIEPTPAPTPAAFLDTVTKEPVASLDTPSSLRSPPVDNAPSMETPVLTPPHILQAPRPRYPRVARRLGRSATVRLRVLVDETGKPVETELLSDPIGLGFEQEAKRAVMASRWTAATRDGTEVSDWVALKVEFKP
ncbi:MAG: TonB family protein [Acidobacteriota bacterium]|nr:TonB family protein [Acidobacteriota bacterium]